MTGGGGGVDEFINFYCDDSVGILDGIYSISREGQCELASQVLPQHFFVIVRQTIKL